MTTNKDDNPPGRTVTPQSADAEQRAGVPYRDADELDPRNQRGHGDKRAAAQGRGNDPDRG